MAYDTNEHTSYLQRFSRRSRHSNWTEHNKERCRRLESLGLMTDSGREVCPDFSAEFVVDMIQFAVFDKVRACLMKCKWDLAVGTLLLQFFDPFKIESPGIFP